MHCGTSRFLGLGLILGLLALPSAARAVQYDDCDARFIAFLGSDTYQFSPALPGPSLAFFERKVKASSASC